jgi:hypothetical protein
MPHIDQPAEYVIRTAGCLGTNVGQDIIDWFGTVKIEHHTQGPSRTLTTLSAVVTDQAGLVGLIRHLHGLGIVLLSIERKVPSEQE